MEYIDHLEAGNLIIDVDGMFMITDCKDCNDEVTVMHLADGSLELKYIDSLLEEINSPISSIDFLNSIEELEDWLKKPKGTWKW
ncbi:SET domain-containing protein [Vagococcus fluvialis]|uniref:hypothetical protein n=1 Tax=Vagococcus fluvialis TaxID=2738 RepID=UPI001D0AC0C3|nr:hypothetical protein [Vagococcus fluvialis]UDM72626.1 hypothetical protein K5L00_14660 [Vagococcus fluvialis]UDM78349.1 hypothetical protein K5K98_14865 [Vagococcus fluvialis]UDM83901.1 hypothetical protein K5K96_14685 [Vagococcus fluvialis]